MKHLVKLVDQYSYFNGIKIKFICRYLSSGIINNQKKYIINLEDTATIYKTYKLAELLRAYLIFKMCSIDILVDNHHSLLKFGRKAFGDRIFQNIIGTTIFAQFMASNNELKLKNHLQVLSQRNISPMFAYTAPEFHGNSEDGLNLKSLDALFEDNVKAVFNNIKIAAECKQFTHLVPIVATKITFFIDVDTLTNFSSAIIYQNQILNDYIDKISSINKEKLLIKYELNNLSSLKNVLNFHLDFKKSFIDCLDDWDVNAYQECTKFDKEKILKIKDNLTQLAQESKNSGIFFNIDAEQTYINPAIELLTSDLHLAFNKNELTVLSTFQCYLKKTYSHIKQNLEFNKNENLYFGAKIVRGAYMTEERRISSEKGFEDPVHKDIEATAQMYQDVANLLLKECAKENTNIKRLVFATHNQEMVELLVDKISEMQINAAEKGVMFAQLLGNRDFLTYSLAAANIPVAKMTHYSTPLDGIAFLSRRLLENRSGLPSPRREKNLLFKELARRFKNAVLFRN